MKPPKDESKTNQRIALGVAIWIIPWVIAGVMALVLVQCVPVELN